jgi:hypothetical protein
MSAATLLRAYRYPRVTRTASDELTPSAFFSGAANTIYVVRRHTISATCNP